MSTNIDNITLSADWKKRIDEDYKKRGGRKHK